MGKADEALARFEARIEKRADKDERPEQREVHGLLICFTKVEVVSAIIKLSVARALTLLRIPVDCVQASIGMKDGRPVPAFTFVRDVELPCEVAEVARVVSGFWKAAQEEFFEDVAHMAKDKAGWETVAQNLVERDVFDEQLRKLAG
jgi:hypothetical protein